MSRRLDNSQEPFELMVYFPKDDLPKEEVDWVIQIAEDLYREYVFIHLFSLN